MAGNFLPLTDIVYGKEAPVGMSLPVFIDNSEKITFLSALELTPSPEKRARREVEDNLPLSPG